MRKILYKPLKLRTIYIPSVQKPEIKSKIKDIERVTEDEIKRIIKNLA